MGCPGGTPSAFKRAFRAKRELPCTFFWKTGDFSYYNLFLGKRKEKLARKARLVLNEYIASCSCPPGHPIILLKCNYFNMAPYRWRKFAHLRFVGYFIDFSLFYGTVSCEQLEILVILGLYKTSLFLLLLLNRLVTQAIILFKY